MISEYLQMKNSWNAVVYLSVPTYLHMNHSIATVPWKLMSYCDLLICKEFSNLALFRQSLMLMQTRKKQQTALVKNYNKTVEPLYFQMHFILVEFTEHVKFVNLANNWCQFETLPLWFAVTAYYSMQKCSLDLSYHTMHSVQNVFTYCIQTMSAYPYTVGRWNMEHVINDWKLVCGEIQRSRHSQLSM